MKSTLTSKTLAPLFLLALTGLVSAAPASKFIEIVEEELAPVQAPAVQAAPAPRAPAPRASAAAPRTVTPSAARAATSGAVAAARPTGRSVIALSTAYNSLPNQTDSTPFITATGTRTRPGVVAMSRDMLRIFPYGTRVMIEDLSGQYNFSGRVFIVEDTMHQRKTNQVDVWMPSYREALNWGRRQVRITALR